MERAPGGVRQVRGCIVLICVAAGPYWSQQDSLSQSRMLQKDQSWGSSESSEEAVVSSLEGEVLEPSGQLHRNKFLISKS